MPESSRPHNDSRERLTANPPDYEAERWLAEMRRQWDAATENMRRCPDRDKGCGCPKYVALASGDGGRG